MIQGTETILSPLRPLRLFTFTMFVRTKVKKTKEFAGSKVHWVQKGKNQPFYASRSFRPIS